MRRQQAGVALITVMLISAVITLMLFAMTEQQVLDGRRAGNIVQGYQAYMLAEGAEGWAKRVLLDDASKGAADNQLENWTQVLPPIEVEGGVISGNISDYSGCFNINNLVDNGKGSGADIAAYRRLLAALGLDAGLADATLDWLDSDAQVSFPNGAESEYYGRLEQPYAIANRMLLSSSELLAIRDYNAEIYAKLHPHVCALPRRSRVNINFATVPVLMSMATGLTEATAQAIIEARDKRQNGLVTKAGFASMNELFELPQMKALLDANAGLKAQIEASYGVSSDFFMLQTEAVFNKADVVVYSLLERNKNKVTTHYRAQGSY